MHYALRYRPMERISPGTRGEHRVLVTSEIAIDFLSIEEARVLRYAASHLEPRNGGPRCGPAAPRRGLRDPAAEVNVKHLAATPLGMSAVFRAEVTHVDGNRVRFRVEVFDEQEKIAEGTHERYVVNIARFATRVQAKAAGTGQ